MIATNPVGIFELQIERSVCAPIENLCEEICVVLEKLCIYDFAFRWRYVLWRLLERVVGYNNKIHRNGIKRAVRKTEEDSAIIIDSR